MRAGRRPGCVEVDYCQGRGGEGSGVGGEVGFGCDFGEGGHFGGLDRIESTGREYDISSVD